MKFSTLVLFCVFGLLGCSNSKEGNPRQVFFGMWSDPAVTELSVGMEFGKGKEIGHVGVFADDNYGTLDLYFNGNDKGSQSRGGVVMFTTGGILEVKGNASKDLVFIGVEQIGTEVFKITEIEEIEAGSVDLTIDHRSE